MEKCKQYFRGSINGSLIRFFIAAYIVFVIFFTSLTILPMYVVNLGGTEFDSGLQTTLFFIAAVILRLYFGPMADNKGRKIPLLIGAFVFATSGILFMFSTEVWHLTLARIYQSIALATFLSSGSSLVADMAPLKSRGTYIGIYRLIITLSILSGPLMAVEVINSYDYNSWFFLTFLFGALALILILFIKAPAISPDKDLRFMHSIFLVLRNKYLWPIFGFIALTSISYGATLTFASLYVGQINGVANPGIYFVYFGISGVIANLIAGYLSDKYGRALVVWPAAIILGLGLVVLAFAPFITLAVIVSGLLTGFGWSGSIVALVAWLVDRADDKIRATALSIQESIIDSFIALGSLLFGIISAVVGMQSSFFITGVIVVVVSAVLISFTKNQFKQPAN
ncbi:MAG: MFS transporter [Clostridia bacterium]|nr:MFS transporter [Clostridia bacterium]